MNTSNATKKKNQELPKILGVFGALIGGVVAGEVSGDSSFMGPFWYGAPIGAIVGAIIGSIIIAPSRQEVALKLAKDSDYKEKVARIVNREWSSTATGNLITAIFLRQEKDFIVLMKTDKSLVKMRLDKLADADKQYIETLRLYDGTLPNP